MQGLLFISLTIMFKSALHRLSKRHNASTITGKQTITLQQHAEWIKNGYIIVRGLFDKEEMNILSDTIECDEILHKNEFSVNDGEGRKASLAIWDYLSNDTYANFMASRRMYKIVSGLMNNQCMMHYHTKLMLKHPQIGGAFEWHQDYGYWYQNGLLFPDLLTAFIAVNDCNQSNGCLEILSGSHAMGRIDHIMIGGQTSADPERIEHIEKVCPSQYVELQSGDTLFFHCNLLHRSAPNLSDGPRYALLAAYNTKANVEYKKHHHYSTDITIREDECIKQMGVVPTFDENIFLDPKKDLTTVVVNEDD